MPGLVPLLVFAGLIPLIPPGGPCGLRLLKEAVLTGRKRSDKCMLVVQTAKEHDKVAYAKQPKLNSTN